ncbi:alanine--tRNA ligase [Candidatus Magnetominusculus xianensis]|uniref:Alanine--tRNA ligase n=1 Tax=Candidatus Magnetominusculus xianensis TaxID=1748249 RepID=A0ABR5SJI8_9BACT|nr:alanine--tRNA ligase [Candidatus Magnetominusculus xianensis]KWT94628.1 alanyl-tRNA synthetase [Candidatus Magnetominusculus xianensis]MBF0403340.1 alanine--tRNA ligase [Nitrospirota bacterium]
MKGKEIRQRFLEYFYERGHERVKSSSLIPKNDPSLLFTSAGMVQFKGAFLGTDSPGYSRAATCQKCMRAGGKQSDIENVGFTARHHTFFEMLGNFSFGDYFKKDAIVFAWELLTHWYKLPKDKLWVSVFEDDDEAIDLWTQHTELKNDKIVRLGAKDNFWQMGDTGPCGPCSEIIIDQGEAMGCGRPECAVGCDCDRYLELWNLVFMQYDRSADGTLNPLPKPSIDTGMGLERITSVLQNKQNNFDTDLFAPIIDAITAKAHISYGKDKKLDVSTRVIADHIRSVTFLLSEGLMPSNEGRGYVARRIIRRASRHARKLGVGKPFLHKLIRAVAEASGDIYPELSKERERSEEILKFEEERFFRTLDQGSELLDEIIASVKAAGLSVIPGAEAFRLYDTYGFPMDLTMEAAKENSLRVDEEGFDEEMKKQRTRGKLSWAEDQAGISGVVNSIYNNAVRISGETYFLGYELLETDAIVTLMLKNGEQTDILHKGDEAEIILDKSPFYGESGGQSGDRGIIQTEKAVIEVRDTKKTPNSLIIHRVYVKSGTLKQSETVSCRVDKRLRTAAARNHTATHLLHAALRDLIGDHIKQAGSLVTPDRLRFDFTHFYPITDEEKQKLEDMINAKIMEDLPVATHTMGINEAIDYGATALFDEKYGAEVRVVEIEGFSKELCGGTHCRMTGQIGPFMILSEGSIASGVRRVEAITGTASLALVRHKIGELKTVSELLKTETPLERLPALIKKNKELEKELQSLKTKDMGRDISSFLGAVKEIDGVKVLISRRDGLNQKDLRDFADKLKEKLGSGIIIAASTMDEQSSFIAMVTKDLTGKYHAGKILKVAAELAGGKGGGRADMAQGGTKELDKLDAALNGIYDIIRANH